uniref:Uncharacterized protein n=1 Tax=Nelumbo nucifera TaxID=4432 RepID=A0A822YFV3_NELNU|nr:TPA_asm: hypothetical protein HUJ06_031334 [Nelumbo nucifera]
MDFRARVLEYPGMLCMLKLSFSVQGYLEE